MLRSGLIDVILALLCAVAAPRSRCHGCHGGLCHRRSILTPAPPEQPPSSAAPHHRVLERPPSPFPDRSAYRSMEPSNPDTSSWGHRGRPCAVHGWGCPNRVALAQGLSSSSRQGEEGREEEDDEHRITVVTGPVRALVIHRTVRISVGPCGRPHGPLAPHIETTPSTSSTSPTLAAPPPPPLTLPSPEASPSGSGTPPELLSPCDN
jgi:hypothetical protein